MVRQRTLLLCLAGMAALAVGRACLSPRTAAPRPLRTLRHGYWPWDVAFSPDGAQQDLIPSLSVASLHPSPLASSSLPEEGSSASPSMLPLRVHLRKGSPWEMSPWFNPSPPSPYLLLVPSP